MGRLKVIKAGPLATVQDKGRFGYRKYGIPQSGAMDVESMKIANQLVGNDPSSPVIEFALMGMKMEVLAKTTIGVVGALVKVNGRSIMTQPAQLEVGDQIEIGPPSHVYGYFAIGGQLQAKDDFGSYSTYLMAGFGGLAGRALKANDELESSGHGQLNAIAIPPVPNEEITTIRILKGPEWGYLEESIENRTFQIDPSSNRMGIRLKGDAIKCRLNEIQSSAVIPGIVQLPSNGQPIVLMNDCQTTGGYPRIGKVIEEDLGKVAQVRGGKKVKLVLSG